MWRAFFFAIGAMLLILGVECLIIESATFKADPPQPVQTTSTGWFQEPKAVDVGPKSVKPPEWIPWSCIASGAIVILYSFTLPARWGSSGGQ